jgi:hypothetical protein
VDQFEHYINRIKDANEFRYVHRPTVYRSYLDLLRFYHLVIFVECDDGRPDVALAP